MPGKKENEEEEVLETENFSELIRYPIPGFIIGLLLGISLDNLGYQRSSVRQWLVHTFAGDGESIFEGIYSIRQRLSGATGSMADMDEGNFSDWPLHG